MKRFFYLKLILIILINSSLLIASEQIWATKKKYRWHTYAYSGYAWSRLAEITNPDPNFFAIVAANDTDNATLSHVNFNGLALHYSLKENISGGFSFESYGVFNYQKFHENGNPNQENIGPSYLRQFLMNHQAAMLELYFKPHGYCYAKMPTIKIAPLFGFGVGVGINNMFNFATVSYDPINIGTQFTTIPNNNIHKSPAWRLELGLNFATLQSNITFGVSYRYDMGGKFASGTLYEISNNQANFTFLPAWQGKLKTNQIKIYINANFD